MKKFTTVLSATIFMAVFFLGMAGADTVVPGTYSQIVVTYSCDLPLCKKMNKRKPSYEQNPVSYPLSRAPYRQLISPISGRITSYFGLRHGRKHEGIDIAARSGQPIVSAADGTVVFSGWRSGYGRMVIVQHNRRLKTVYAHNSRNLVRRGEKVRQGQVIALVGNTGRSTGPHLHFEVRHGSSPQNPLNYIS